MFFPSFRNKMRMIFTGESDFTNYRMRRTNAESLIRKKRRRGQASTPGVIPVMPGGETLAQSAFAPYAASSIRAAQAVQKIGQVMRRMLASPRFLAVTLITD
jgi:hypothetical protein